MDCVKNNGIKCGTMASQPYIEVTVWTKESEASWLLGGRQCRRLYDSTNAACSAAGPTKNESSSAPLQFQEWERWDRMRFTHHCVLHTTSPTLKPFKFCFTQTTQFGKEKWSYCQTIYIQNSFVTAILKSLPQLRFMNQTLCGPNL